KVTREKSKLRLALTGPSGAGKTLSALLLAYGITNDWSKIALIDTEHGRAKFYANRSDFGTGEFLYQEMSAPYSPDKYISMVNEGAEAVGADGVVIVDSFSHCWDNEGGVLDIKSQIAEQPKKNDYSAWADAGKIQNNLVNSVLSANCHTIVTMRTKMAYAMEQNDKGKTVPVKIGLAPVQRENTEYEFDIVLNIARNHVASASKDTTFLDKWSGVITPELGKSLKEWLDEGVEPHRCTDCGKVITGKSKKTADEIAEGTLKNYGRKLCWKCMTAEIKKLKERKNESQTLSDSTCAEST
ncbi:MAG: ATP-binding protein, partial [Ruminococcus sp.]|nr:ATP-binding protein [Ruminococcus sp.]